MKRNKPVKIKRYKRSFTNSDTKRKAVKWLCFILALAVLFLCGFLFAKPIIDAASGFWYSVINPKNKPDESQSASLPVDSSLSQSSDSTVDSSAEITPQTELFSQNAKWQFVSAGALSSQQSIESTADKLKENGIDYAVITIKDTTGTVYCDSGVDLAKGAVSETAFDAKAVTEAFISRGVQPIAYITAYQDSAAAYSDRDMAVKYLNEDTMWLDSSLELGGKPWLNPYSEKAAQYIADLTKEAADNGFVGVVVSKLQFPSGYSTESCYYSGADDRTKSQVLADTVALLQQTARNGGAELWVEIPATAVLGNQANTYGEQPFGMGIDNLFVKVQLTRLEDGGTYTGGIGEQQLAELCDTASAGGTKRFALYVADSALDAEVSSTLYDECGEKYTQKVYA